MNPANLFRSLTFRLSAPLLGLVLVVGAGFGLIVLELVEEFQRSQAREDLVWTSRVAYKIIDDRYFELVQIGDIDHPARTRIQQGRAIDNLETFMHQKDFQAMIFDERRQVLLLTGDFPAEFFRHIERPPAGQINTTTWQGTAFYVYQVRFAPWDWSILLLKREAHYLALQNQLRSVYLATAALLLVAGVTIFVIQSAYLKKPVNQIIDALRQKKPPEYRGVQEFSYLSESIREMMVSLEERERFLSNVLDSIQDGIGLLNHELLVVRANPALDRLFPQSAPLTGKPGPEVFKDFFQEEPTLPKDLFTRPWFTQIDRGSSEPNLARHLELYTFPVIGDHRQPAGHVIFYCRDISEQKFAEAALLEMDRLKDEFISAAAHELQTPLTSVIGFSEMLCTPSQLGGITEEQREEFSQIIHEKSEMLSKTVDDLLDISRIAAGKMINLEVGSHDPVRIVQEVLREFRMQYPNHQFVADVDGLAGEPALLDRNRLLQILQNLLSNAAKYSPRGTTVTLWGQDQGMLLQFAVSDQGKGMTPEQVARIYDKFYRADHSLHSASGLGIGMNIVKKIVESHGGTIGVESQPGRGTRVFFSLLKNPPIQ